MSAQPQPEPPVARQARPQLRLIIGGRQPDAGPPLVVTPGGPKGRGWAKEHHQRSVALVVDEYGNAVAYQRRCALCQNWRPLNNDWFSLRKYDSRGFSTRCRVCDAFDTRQRHRRKLADLPGPMPGQCERCGHAKLPGVGQRLCVDCKPVKIRACNKCGGERARGKQLCEDCHEMEHWRSQVGRRAKRATERKACRGCGKPKGDGPRRIYCDACLRWRAQPQPCRRCGERNPRQPRAQVCDHCREKIKAKVARNKRLWDLRNKDKVEAYRKAYRRRSLTIEQRVRRAEARRERYRLYLETEGRAIQRHVTPKYGAPGDSYDNIPRVYAAPLAVAIEQDVIARDIDRHALCREVGTTERTLYAWRTGERTWANHAVADGVLVGLDLLWHDVYDPQAAPPAVFHWRQRDDVSRWVDAVFAAALAWDGEDSW